MIAVNKFSASGIGEHRLADDSRRVAIEHEISKQIMLRIADDDAETLACLKCVEFSDLTSDGAIG